MTLQCSASHRDLFFLVCAHVSVRFFSLVRGSEPSLRKEEATVEGFQFLVHTPIRAVTSASNERVICQPQK